jgi:CHC2 zinc finger
MTEYHSTSPPKTTDTHRYRGVSLTTPINAAKEAVPIIDLADRLTSLRRSGKEWVGRCPLPDHEDQTPSFTVNKAKNLWWCHGCLRGGDVVKLAQLAWNYTERESHTAAADVLHEFGHEVPKRPPSWHRKQERQRSVRDTMDRERVEHVRMLVFRLIWMPWLKRLPDWAREDATQSAWECSRSMALRLYEQRRA